VGGEQEGKYPLRMFFIPKNSFFYYLVEEEQIRKSGDRMGERGVFAYTYIKDYFERSHPVVY